MSRYRDSGDEPRKKSGMPTWVIVLLSALLLLALLCAGAIAFLVHTASTKIDEMWVETTHNALDMVAQGVRDYKQSQGGYPANLNDIKALPNYNYQTFGDYRDQAHNMPPFVYLPPLSNSQNRDILAHTRTDGPKPILAVQLDGTRREFKTPHDLDLALTDQQTRPLPDRQDFAPPPKPAAGQANPGYTLVPGPNGSWTVQPAPGTSPVPPGTPSPSTAPQVDDPEDVE